VNRPSIARGLDRLAGLRSSNSETAIEMAAKRDRFASLAEHAPPVFTGRQLFPTPPTLADRVVAMADIAPGDRVLEPSAGFGRLIEAIGRAAVECDLVTVEMDFRMVRHLRERWPAARHHQGNFRAHDVGLLGRFDVVVMNPPFERGEDIQHISHALQMLKPGGRLVSICAAGPKQREKIPELPHFDEWVDLPSGSFRAEGTSVSAAIVTFCRG